MNITSSRDWASVTLGVWCRWDIFICRPSPLVRFDSLRRVRWIQFLFSFLRFWKFPICI